MTIARSKIVILAALCAGLLCCAVTAPAMPPSVTPRIGWHLVNGKWLKASGSCDWSDLLTINAHGNNLTAAVKLSDKSAALLRGGRMVAIEIGPAQDLYNVTVGDMRPLAQRREPEASLALRELPDEARPERPENSPLHPIMVVVHGSAFRVVARGQLRGTPVIVTLMCGEQRGREGARFTVNAIGDPQSRINCGFQADSFAELAEQHPAELRKYLSPVLRHLGGADPFAPGAADVYGAFAEIEPEAAAQEKLAALLPGLSDPDPHQRQLAFEELQTLGAAVACAALRWPDSDLNPQQRLSIKQYLRSQSRRRDETAAELRRDPLFLVDCLEFDDARVRSLAKDELERALSRTIDLDTTRSDACAEVAAKLRRDLMSKPG
jgi:hypothetical protein